jgi:ATP-dependent Clp protease protease subunit
VLAASSAALSSVLPARVASAQSGAAPQTNASSQYISFQAPINETTSARLIAAAGGLIQKGVDDIHLIIASGGGSVSAALLIYGFLRGLPAKLTTYNVSTIQSAAMIVFLAGEKRTASQNAIFMFHPFKESFSGNPSFNTEDLTERQELLSIDIKRVADVYQERTSLTAGQVEEFNRHAVYFDAVAARTAGIVHEIIPLSIPRHATITTVNP